MKPIGKSVVPLTLELAFRVLLHGGLDLLIGDRLFRPAGQVDHGDVGGGHPHGHAGEFAVELWDHLSDGLGGTRAARDDVLGGRTTTSPVLGRRPIDGLLGGGIGVDGRHQALDETPFVIHDLGQRGQAVSGARGVGQDVDVGFIGGVVDAHDEHGGIGGRSRDDHLLGAALQVGGGLLGGGEDPGRFDNVFGTRLGPGDVGRVPLHIEADPLAVHDQHTPVDLHGAFELAMLTVVLDQIGLLNCVSLLPAWMDGAVDSCMSLSPTAYLVSMKGSLTATTSASPCSILDCHRCQT